MACYATFTVCTLQGKVVGCVDVPGKLALTQASRELKEALLLDCGIAYTVVNAFNLPDASTMRELFLGEAASADARASGDPWRRQRIPCRSGCLYPAAGRRGQLIYTFKG